MPEFQEKFPSVHFIPDTFITESQRMTAACGFNSQAHFTRVYAGIYRRTPGAERKGVCDAIADIGN